MKRILLAIALAGVFGVAQAGNSNGCQGNCPTGDTTNNITNAGGAGGVGYGGTGIGIGQGGNAVANGGQGGQGGAGGIGIGGSVIGSGNSSNSNHNDNRNTNTNLQGQAQSQQQGQAQGQSQRSINRNDNRSSARNTNSNANSGNNSAQAVTVQGDTYEAARTPVATAYAAPLAASNGTCMGSSSVGAQAMTVGVSIGSTWNDKGCDMRYDAEALRLAGQPLAAVARLCQKAEIAAAMKAAGTACPGDVRQATSNVTVASRKPTADEKAVRYTGTDPIVRARLGLPPLK